MYLPEENDSTIPFVNIFIFIFTLILTMQKPTPLCLGQDGAEEILRSHLEKYSIHVEFGTELVSFTQDDEGVVAEILRTRDGHGTRETPKVNWLVGADGAKGIFH